VGVLLFALLALYFAVKTIRCGTEFKKGLDIVSTI
jgi:hypothetical protein